MLSNMQRVQVSTANSPRISEVPILSGKAVGDVHVSTDTVLFTGMAPFMWSLDVYLQLLKQPVPQWFITLHITAPGSITRVYKSATVEIFPNKVCAVPFDAGLLPLDTQGSYGYCMNECEVTGIGGSEHYMYVTMIPGQSPDCSPVVEVFGTDVNTNWIIGAREIVLTDPPIVEGQTTRAEAML